MLAVGAGGDCFDIFLSSIISLFFLPLFLEDGLIRQWVRVRIVLTFFSLLSYLFSLSFSLEDGLIKIETPSQRVTPQNLSVQK